MKQYLFSVYHRVGQPLPTGEAMQKIFADVGAFNEKMMKEKLWVFAGGLHGPESATVAQVKNGEVALTDGLYAEAKEYIGGFWVLKAKDLDAALKIAAEATRACAAPVEVRPFQEGPGQD